MILRVLEKWFCKIRFFFPVCRTTVLPPSKLLLRVQIKRLNAKATNLTWIFMTYHLMHREILADLFKFDWFQPVQWVEDVVWGRGLKIEGVKGQLISKCPYEKSVSSKIPTKIFPRFLPWKFTTSRLTQKESLCSVCKKIDSVLY